MLELKNIKKDYPAGNGLVHALKGIDLQFRKSDFVSILGPSGCGKTTMLNIIGGLDHYTDGDLVINGRSTKDFKDRDWDTYRNHSIGFVFQTYNLIPHQSVLQNVELALTLSGVSKKERKKRAIQALTDVGLADQLRKRPSEMSGGQMQRVAIARALVNNPDIILADEPTGALDTETSIQVMDILKEISKDRLVIMVTHNPDLAQKYSTRIIRMLDGVITDDSAPLTADEINRFRAEDKKAIAEAKKERKPSMRFHTAFGLSLKNLLTKRGRTVLTSFAGSIGIIGIALIFAVSQGMTNYINLVQEETLSSYPLTLQASNADLSSLMSAFMSSAESSYEHDKDAIYSKPVIYDLINALNNMETTENDLASFKTHLDQLMAESGGNKELQDAISGILYSYNLNLQIYTKDLDGNVIQSDAQLLMQKMMLEYMGLDMSGMLQMQQNSSISTLMSMSPSTSYNVWQEMLPGDNGKPINDLFYKQYDLIYGSWPNSYNEIVLVVDENNELDDMTLYALGLASEEEISNIMNAVMNQEQLPVNTKSWSYEEICGLTFRTVLPGDCYVKNASGLYADLRETQDGMRMLYSKGFDLKITGIIRPAENAIASMLSGSIGYTTMLTEYVIENAASCEAVKAQLESPDTDIFTGLPFRDNTGSMTDEQKTEEFKAHIAALDTLGKARAYIAIKSIPSAEMVDATVTQSLAAMTRADMEAAMIQALTTQMGMSAEDVESYVNAMSEEDLKELFSRGIREQFIASYAASVEAEMGNTDPAVLAAALDMEMAAYTQEQFAQYYDEVLEFSESDYESNLIALGRLDLDEPSSISLYASSFESKDVIEEMIADYNKTVDEIRQITYTDYVGLMMSSITTIIDAITYVLIAFVAISLVVSSIMIGVITLISVQERTKEIGILRAIGASKRNVSSMFNAETVIIGFCAGTLGVLVTYLLCIPINAIIQGLTGISNLEAVLPVSVALILVAISTILTLISGLIPSRSAAKKDPVVALRSE